MRKKNLLSITGVVIITIFILSTWLIAAVSSDVRQLDNIMEGTEKKYLLTDQEIAEQSISCMSFTEAKAEFDEGIVLKANETKEISLSVKNAGKYFIVASYGPVETNIFENNVDISVDNQKVITQLPFLWADEISEIRRDRYGNEIVPEQSQLPMTYNYIEDYSDFSRFPMVFNLQSGENIIRIKPQNQPMKLYGLYVVKITKSPSYKQYVSAINDKKIYEGELISIEGEDYRAKSDSYIRGRSVANTSVSPYNPYVKLLNATDDKANKKVGQKIIYEVNVPEDGIYYLSFKYSQPLKIGGQSYRTIEIDGQVPYEELHNVGFMHTGIDKYDNYTVGGDAPLGIFLAKGIHTIGLKVTATPVEQMYNQLLDIVNEINDMGIQLKKIKGSNSDVSASVDKNRTWDIIQYIPDILERLNDWENRITTIYSDLEGVNGTEPSYASDLILAAQNLNRLRSKPREIPNKMALLSDDSSSAAQLISLVLSKMYEQNLSIDKIYIHGQNEKLPSPHPAMFDSMITGMKQFIYSFSDVMNDEEINDNEGEILRVWVNKPTQYVEVIRELAAQDFTKKTGIQVVFSIMPDEKKITLANSTGTNPDLALGLSHYRPAEFAMRDMAVNLLKFDDFLDWYSKEYNLEALSPMAYEDGIYGASETQDFYVLFYRKDILDMLNIQVPNTWEDVKAIMPILHRNAMNFNIPLANNVGYKSFEATGGFIFQNGGDYYADDGFSSNFSNPNTIKGLREMVDLYRTYGLAQNVPNFFNAFRSGSVPIGISNFSTYLQLQVGAPELNGRWDIALVPGTVQEDGTISRYWSADATSALIFSNTKNEQASYKFLKWWLSSDIQLKYAIDLQMKYGPDYIWNTANHVALAGLSYPSEHKNTILEQWSWQKEALRHPASYILEREVSNAWIGIVTEGEDFQARIDEATLNSNREIRRKLTEFGYYDEDGNKLKNYNIHLIDELIKKGGKQ